MTQTTAPATTQPNSTSLPQTAAILDDNNREMNEYLKKLVDIVPYLKNIQNNNGQSLLNSFQYINLNDSTNTSSSDGISNNSSDKEISDLQILQSALDYIVDLQQEIYMNDEEESGN